MDGARLVAYVVASTQGAVSSRDLRTYMLGKLPSYMVPSTFISLAELPLTPNGKVDRNALAALSPESPSNNDGERDPRASIEEIVSRIWCQLLGCQSVRVDEDFFDLGGHSLMAMRVISRINQQLRLNVPLQLIFEAPTVQKLALAVEELMLSEIESLSDEEAERLQQQSAHCRMANP